ARPRADSPASGTPAPAAGWKASWLRSPIQGLGSCEMPMPCSTGRFRSSLAAWYSYSQVSVDAFVIGVQKLNPLGTAVAGTVLPRENDPLDSVPRRVST